MKRIVYVYRHTYGAGTDRAYSLAYLTEQTSGACVHEVEGETRGKLQAAAIREHREKCGDRITR